MAFTSETWACEVWPDSKIAELAKAESMGIVTADLDFADIRQYPPNEYSGIVVLRLPPGCTASAIKIVVRAFFERTELVATLPGKLAIVEPGRVRIRG